MDVKIFSDVYSFSLFVCVFMVTGGAPDMATLTGGKFSSGITGCVKNLSLFNARPGEQPSRPVDLQLHTEDGKNVRRCSSQAKMPKRHLETEKPLIHIPQERHESQTTTGLQIAFHLHFNLHTHTHTKYKRLLTHVPTDHKCISPHI